MTDSFPTMKFALTSTENGKPFIPDAANAEITKAISDGYCVELDAVWDAGLDVWVINVTKIAQAVKL